MHLRFESAHVFTYGSLMFDEVWAKVVCGRYVREPAYVEGFERRAIKAAPYPALIRSQFGTRVEGCLYRNVSPKDMHRLDLFEGDEYERQTCIAYVEDGAQAECAVYIWRASLRSRLSSKSWDVELFRRRGLKEMAEYW